MANDIEKYEKIPEESFPVRILNYVDHSYVFPIHWHEHTEIHYIFEGSGTVKCNDETVSVGAGDCVVINGNELHQGISGRCTYLCIIIPPSFFDQNRVLFNNHIRDARIGELSAQIRELFLSGGAVERLELRAYTSILAAHLIRHHANRFLNESMQSQYFHKMDKINGAVKFINENYGKPLTTATLAATVHLSEGYFCRVFKEVTGKSAVEYLHRVRIDKADRMLKKTDMSISEIAFCCGFEDANYFSRIFKRLNGKTPQSVRTEHWQDNNNEVK